MYQALELTFVDPAGARRLLQAAQEELDKIAPGPERRHRNRSLHGPPVDRERTTAQRWLQAPAVLASLAWILWWG